MGIPLIYGSARRGESELSSRGRPPTPRSSNCGQQHGFDYRRVVYLICPGIQMLHAWISFLRHSPTHFPEGNLVYMCISVCRYFSDCTARIEAPLSVVFFLSILIWCGFPHVTHGMLARRSTLFLPQKPSQLASKLVFLNKCRRSSKRI